MATYKKRGRAGYVGKKEAKDKISRERNYAKKEIRQELKEIEEGDDFRYKHKAKKVLTPEQKLEKNINWYQMIIEQWERPNRKAGWMSDGWISGIIHRYKEKLKKLKKEKDEKK